MFYLRKPAPHEVFPAGTPRAEDDRRRRATTRRGRLALGLTVVNVLGLGATGTWAAFSSSAFNGSNSLAAGTVSLTDDDSSQVMFAVTGMKPGDTHAKCIKVTLGAGSLSSEVRLYAAVSGSLAPDLDVTVERHWASAQAPGGTHVCTSFVASQTYATNVALNTFPSTFAAGYDGTTWAATNTAVYRVTMTLPSGTTTGQGLTAAVDLTWEARAGT